MRPPVAIPLAAMMIAVPLDVVDLPRVLDRARQREPAGVERARAGDHRSGGVRIQVLGMLAVERRRLDRHRTVDEGGQPRDAARVLERAEVIDELLRSPHGEGRHHERAAAVDGGPDDALDLVGDGRGVVQPVAVRRLHEDVVGVAQGLRVQEDGRRVAADVPREDETAHARARPELEMDRGRAQDVAGSAERRGKPWQELHRLVVLDAGDLLGRLGALFRGVERKGGCVLGSPPLVVVRRLLFLEMAGVGQQDPREIAGPVRRGHPSGEAVLDEPRQVSGVIDVGVSQADGVDPREVDRKRIPVPEAEGLQSLVESAVDQESAPVGLDEELGSR